MNNTKNSYPKFKVFGIHNDTFLIQAKTSRFWFYETVCLVKGTLDDCKKKIKSLKNNDPIYPLLYMENV